VSFFFGEEGVCADDSGQGQWCLDRLGERYLCGVVLCGVVCKMGLGRLNIERGFAFFLFGRDWRCFEIRDVVRVGRRDKGMDVRLKLRYY
jgi:hypothetical protein